MDKNQYFNDMNNHDDNLPESFDWENMEAGIMDKLHDLEKASEPFPNRKQWTYIGALIGLLLLTGLWICFIENADNDISSASIITEVLEEGNSPMIEEVSAPAHSTFKADEQLAKNRPEDTNTIDNLSGKEAKSIGIKATNKQELASIAVALSEDESESRIEDSTNKSTAVSIPTNTNLLDLSTSLKLEDSNGGTKDNLNKERPIDLVKNVETLNLLQQINTKPTTLDLPLDIKEQKIPAADEDKGRNNNSKWSLGVYAGLSTWKANYTGSELATMKFDAEKSIASYGIQVKLMYDLNENWQIGTGLEFMQRESRFEFYGERDSTVIQNIVTSIDVNAETGETITEHREDVALNAVLWENVVHYNKYSQVAIPLIINRKWSLSDKIFVNTGTGLRYVLSAQEAGKDLEKNESAYQTKDIKAGDYSYKNSFGLLANASINYQFSKKWNFGLSTDLNWSLTDVDNQTDVSLKPFGVFASAGLQYQF